MSSRILGTILMITMTISGCQSISTQADPAPERSIQDNDADEAGPSPRERLGPALKKLGRGLYLIGNPRGLSKSFIDHMVVGGPWAAFEPRDQTFDGPGWERIGGALRRYPKAKLRIRILAGRGAPRFVKQLGGPPISGPGKDCSDEGGIAIVQPSNQLSSCVPYFWEDPVLDQYAELMTEVARRFEESDRVLDVVNSACMTNWAEPFIRSGSDLDSNTRLWKAGLNERTDRRCQLRSMEIHDRVFRTTRTSLAAHQQWQVIVDPATDADGVAPSWTKERELLDRFRNAYGNKLVVQNNGLGAGEGCSGGGETSELFCWMVDDTGPNGFQTEGDRKLERDGTTILDVAARGIRMGACFIEHNHFGLNHRRARRYDARLRANCSKATHD
jgi:hypothetical protein